MVAQLRANSSVTIMVVGKLLPTAAILNRTGDAHHAQPLTSNISTGWRQLASISAAVNVPQDELANV